VTSFVSTFVGNHGLLAVFVLMTLAAVLPAASELTMLYGGALASGAIAGQIALFGHRFGSGLHAYAAVALTGLVGNLLGSYAGWLIGLRGGHPLLERYGRYVHVTPARIARAERWFERFEGVAVPLGFATPLVRSFVAIPAGMFDVSLRRFVPSAAAGIALFTFALGGVGWALGASWHTARHDLDYLEAAVVVIAVAVLVTAVVRSRRSIKMAGSASDSAR
jgi:membrane protein DedA with SNARE-associated domain